MARKGRKRIGPACPPELRPRAEEAHRHREMNRPWGLVKRFGVRQTRTLLNFARNNLGAGRELQLPGNHHGLTSFDALRDHGEIALALPRFHLAEVER